MPINEDDRGTYIFNSKDLCMIEHIPEMVNAGIDSFKIEGRMKTALYVATVARTYRKAINDYFESEELYRANMSYYQTEISKCTYRQFTTGFYFNKADDTTQIYDHNSYIKEYTYLGMIKSITEEGLYEIEQKNKFSQGDNIEIMLFNGENLQLIVKNIYDENMNPIVSAPHPKQRLYISLDAELPIGTILRRQG